MNVRRKHKGFTLVELMIGLALGSFIILGALGATAGLLRGDSVNAARLDQEVRNAAFLFERDVLRSGFMSNAQQALALGTVAYINPFARLDTATPGCVLYSYDANQSGALDIAAGSDERFAFALSNGVLYMRISGTAYDCDTTQGVWEAVSDVNSVVFSAFDVTVSETATAIPSSAKFVRSRTLTYRLTAAAKSAVQGAPQTFANTVKLPNDIVN